jgi:hypothetical protein
MIVKAAIFLNRKMAASLIHIYQPCRSLTNRLLFILYAFHLVCFSSCMMPLLYNLVFMRCSLENDSVNVTTGHRGAFRATSTNGSFAVENQACRPPVNLNHQASSGRRTRITSSRAIASWQCIGHSSIVPQNSFSCPFLSHRTRIPPVIRCWKTAEYPTTPTKTIRPISHEPFFFLSMPYRHNTSDMLRERPPRF